MDDDAVKKEVKNIVYFLAIIWILSLAVYGYVFYSGTLSLQTTQLIFGLLPLILLPLVMVGLWSSKKWGLFLGYVLSALLLINSIRSINLLGMVLWGSVFYHLYKSRNIFS